MRIISEIKRVVKQFRVPLYRNALYIILNSIITGAVGLIFWILAAKYYSTEDVGFGSAIISAMTLLGLLATMGLDYGIIRFLPNFGKDTNAMINSCLTIGGLSSLIAASIFISGLRFWSPALLFMQQEPILLVVFIISTAGWTLYLLLNRTFIAERKASFAMAQGTIFNLLRLVLVVTFTAFFGTVGISASWGIGIIIAIGTGLFLFLPRIQAGYHPFPMIKSKVVNQMVRFSFANYIAILLWVAPSFILPITVLNILGAKANAYFYIAWAIASVLFNIPVGASLSLFAEGSYEEERLGRNTRRSLSLTFALVIPAIVLIFLIGDKFLLIFGVAYAENANQLLRILAISLIPSGLNWIYFGIKRVEMKMKSVIGLSALITTTTLVMSWILLPIIGISATGVAWLSSQGLVTLAIIIRLILSKMSISRTAGKPSSPYIK